MKKKTAAYTPEHYRVRWGRRSEQFTAKEKAVAWAKMRPGAKVSQLNPHSGAWEPLNDQEAL